MRGEHFLLLLEDVAHLLLECKELLVFLVAHRPLHRVHVLLHLALLFLPRLLLLLNLYLLVDHVLLVALLPCTLLLLVQCRVAAGRVFDTVIITIDPHQCLLV